MDRTDNEHRLLLWLDEVAGEVPGLAELPLPAPPGWAQARAVVDQVLDRQAEARTGDVALPDLRTWLPRGRHN